MTINVILNALYVCVKNTVSDSDFYCYNFMPIIWGPIYINFRCESLISF